MKKKTPKNVDTATVLVQIQEQLAMLNNKFDDFMNKSLTDLAQTLAMQKAAATRPVVQTPQPTPARPPVQQHNGRPKFAIVCFQCGKDSELPFKPAPGRAVYCPECFAARKAGNAPKVNNEPKPAVAVQAPVEVKASTPAPVKAKKKAPVAKKPVKKTVVKKTTKKTAKKKK